MTSFHESPLLPRKADQGWALVTGGSGRGGAAIVRALHARGLSVVIHHTPRSLEKARALQAELELSRPVTTELWAADFTAEPFHMPPWLATKGVTVLVCNASAYHASDVGDIDRTHIDIAVHISAHAAILATLQPRPGQRLTLRSVVAVTDIAVDRAPRGHGSSTTAKDALQSMFLALANDWAPHVRFNVVRPRTLPYSEIWTEAGHPPKVKQLVPHGRIAIASAEEIASVVAFLAIDATSMTGQVQVRDHDRPSYQLC